MRGEECREILVGFVYVEVSRRWGLFFLVTMRVLKSRGGGLGFELLWG